MPAWRVVQETMDVQNKKLSADLTLTKTRHTWFESDDAVAIEPRMAEDSALAAPAASPASNATNGDLEPSPAGAR
jgi:hypothetical protein